MLQSIHIQNFRCFEDFKADGFERINLIGGKNNSGKSCLLEGIFAVVNPQNTTKVSSLRDENNINILNKSRNLNTIEFSFSYNYETISGAIVVHENGRIHSSYSPAWFGIQSKIISLNKELPSIDTSKFEITEFSHIKPELIKILKLIDNRITDLKIYFNEKNISYHLQSIGKENLNSVPISSFGEATKSLIKYFLPILEKIINKTNEISILLIDEIENGIHYTAHKEFWQHLFKLCKELNVQVFATTHSLEMIKAFNEVALQEGEASYFEMLRDIDTNEIFVEKHNPEFLNFELVNPKHTVRGE